MRRQPLRMLALVSLLVLWTACTPGRGSVPSTPSTRSADATPAAGGAPRDQATPVPPSTVASGGAVTEIDFFYPVAVGGPITQIIERHVEGFNRTEPGTKVEAVFAGSYADTLTKIQTTLQGGGEPPALAVLLSSDLHTLVDADAIVPLDDQIRRAGDAYLADFFEAFLLNSRYQGKIWSIPFQRSTPVLYYNKDQFREVGLDPDRPPTTWDEQIEYATRLARPDAQRWGLEIPADGMPYWLFQAIALGNGRNVIGESANQVFFNDPSVVEGLQALVDAGRANAIPPGVVQWATAPSDFTAGRASMIWHTTGSLANILREAKFTVGVGFLPGLKQYGVPTGGGNLYIFKKSSDQKKEAAWKLIEYLTSVDQAAKWSIETGYVATRKSSYDTAALREHVARTPQAVVARDQLQYAGKELATHSGPQVQKILSDAVQAALLNRKSPQQALNDAQREAERILSQFRD